MQENGNFDKIDIISAPSSGFVRGFPIDRDWGTQSYTIFLKFEICYALAYMTHLSVKRINQIEEIFRGYLGRLFTKSAPVVIR